MDCIEEAKQRKENSFSYRFSLIFLFIVLSGLLFLIYLVFYPFTLIKPNVQPYKVLTKTVKPGGKLLYQVDSCKYTNVSPTVSRSFIQVPQMITYPAITSFGAVARDCNKTVVAISVPLFLPAGRYFIAIDVDYKIYPLIEKKYHFTTQQFQVN